MGVTNLLPPRSPDHTNDQKNLRVSARICLTLTVPRSRVRVLRAPHRHEPISVVRKREAVTAGAVVSPSQEETRSGPEET